jgi:hypothetical protein
VLRKPQFSSFRREARRQAAAPWLGIVLAIYIKKRQVDFQANREASIDARSIILLLILQIQVWIRAESAAVPEDRGQL